MTNCQAITALLHNAGIKPDMEVETDAGMRSAFEILEAAVMGALDEIEEAVES